MNTRNLVALGLAAVMLMAAFAVMGNVTVNVAAKPIAPAPFVPVVDQDFDEQADGDHPTNWVDSVAFPANLFEVDNSQSHSAPNSVIVTDSSNDIGCAHRDASWTTQNLTLEIMLGNTAGFYNIEVQDTVGDRELANNVAYLSFRATGDIFVYTNSTLLDTGFQYTSGVWHTIVIDIDFATDTWDATYDGTLIVNNIECEKSATSAENLQLLNYNTGAGSSMWVDDVLIDGEGAPIPEWNDSNTAAFPTTTNMDGSGTNLDPSTPVNLATKSLNVSSGVDVLGDVTITLGNLKMETDCTAEGDVLVGGAIYGAYTLELNGAGAQNFNADPVSNLFFNNGASTISVLTNLHVYGYLNISASNDITLSSDVTVSKINAAGIAGNAIVIDSSVSKTIRVLTLNGTETDINYVNMTDMAIDIKEDGGSQSIRNITMAYAHDGSAVGGAVRFNSVISGTYADWYIYQTTWGLRFNGLTWVNMSKITMRDTAKGAAGVYGSGGSIYLSNHDHNITFYDSNIDWQHITFAGTKGNVTSYENNYKVAQVGDSLTQGGPLHDCFWDALAIQDNMWGQCSVSLSNRTMPDYFIQNDGEGGDYLDETLVHLPLLLDTKPNALVIMIGFNDFNHEIPPDTVATLKADYIDLFDMLDSYGQTNVFICNLAPTNGGPVNALIMSFNAWLNSSDPDSPEARGYTVIPETFKNLTENFGVDNTLKETYNWGDGIHFSYACYRALDDILDDYILGIDIPDVINETRMFDSTGMTYEGSPPHIPVSYSENFDSMDEGLSPPEGWLNDTVRPPTAFEVDDTHANSGANSILLSDDGSFASAHHNIVFTTETFNCSIYMSNTNGLWDIELQDTEGNRNNASGLVAVLSFRMGAAICYYNHNAWHDTGYDYTANGWHDIGMKVNFNADTFSIWYDDTLIAEDVDTQHAADRVESIQLVNYNIGGAGGDVWFDDFRVGDDTPPTIVSTTPTDGATGVSILAGTYVFHFSEAMNQSAGSIETTLPGASWAWSEDGLWYNGTYTTLSATTKYYVNLTALEDLSGNVLAGDAEKNFTTGLSDVTPPTIAATTPTDGALDVAIAVGTYRIRFSEAMNKSAGSITTGLPGISWSWSVNGLWRNGTYTALNYQAKYYVNLTGFKDLAGNAMTGDSSRNFTTRNVPDTTAPVILTTSPDDHETNVSRSAGTYRVHFSEAMNVSIGSISTDLPGISWDWSADGRWCNGTYTTLEYYESYNVDFIGLKDDPEYGDTANAMVGDLHKQFTVRGATTTDGTTDDTNDTNLPAATRTIPTFYIMLAIGTIIVIAGVSMIGRRRRD